MVELREKENVNIVNMIYEIRGKQAMLDSDLAKLYQCSNGTKTINQAVKRHINRFPERFMFQLKIDEVQNLWSQIGTANKKSRTLPYAFTEQGVAMLSAILRTNVAEEISIAIMDAFVLMRRYISSNYLEQKYINNQVMKNTEDIKLLQESFKAFDKKKDLNDMFFEGQFYDAYSLLLDIFYMATKNIIIIDNYIDKKFLDLCSKIKINIIIYTKEIDKETFEKYNKQYDNVKVKLSNKYHDRFIIIDNKIMYHCGASFKDLGKKCFAISEFNDINYLEQIINTLNIN